MFGCVIEVELHVDRFFLFSQLGSEIFPLGPLAPKSKLKRFFCTTDPAVACIARVILNDVTVTVFVVAVLVIMYASSYNIHQKLLGAQPAPHPPSPPLLAGWLCKFLEYTSWLLETYYSPLN